MQILNVVLIIIWLLVSVFGLISYLAAETEEEKISAKIEIFGGLTLMNLAIMDLN